MRVLMAVLMLSEQCVSLPVAFRYHTNAGDLLFKVRVVDVARAEPEQRSARVNILPVVVGVRDVELPRILATVAVAVPGEGSLPMVVEISAGRNQSRGL